MKTTTFPGISKTVYSVCYPQTQSVCESFWKNKLPLLHDSLYKNTWSKAQDKMGYDLVKTYFNTLSPWVKINLEDFGFFYPSAGSSEAIREQIVILINKGYKILTVHGEYEGYNAISSALGSPCVTLVGDRTSADYLENIKKQIKKINYPKLAFFISCPSSVDGMYYCPNEIFALMHSLQVEVFVDIAYAGASHMPNQLNLTHPAVEGVFFSLSKIFGVYYHRIGGMISKKQNSLLWGNNWFKNLQSIYLGIELLENVDLPQLHNILKQKQAQAIQSFCKDYKLPTECVRASSVFLLATVPTNMTPPALKEFLYRADLKDTRVCLSEYIEKSFKHSSNDQNKTVTA